MTKTRFVDINPHTDKLNEECGVFGIYNNDDLDTVAITHDALYGLQHRGQISAGITVNKDGNFSTIKDLGMVSEVFPDKVLKKLSSGKITVGHVRYTPNQSLDRAANQPLVLRYKEGSIAISNNGSITNFPEIRKDLERGGAIFQSNSNAELMAYAEGLDMIFGELEETEREAFVSTAIDKGLRMYEDVMDICNIDTSLAGRRKSILAALSVSDGDFTLGSLERMLDIYNITSLIC